MRTALYYFISREMWYLPIRIFHEFNTSTRRIGKYIISAMFTHPSKIVGVILISRHFSTVLVSEGFAKVHAYHLREFYTILENSKVE